MDLKRISKLIQLADKFDQEGKFDMALAVDKVLKSKAARTKPPLKGLKDDVKKSLIVFLLDAEESNQKSCKGLGELFRRMRYFDISDSIKELGLDKVLKEMQKTQDCLDTAKKDFYTMTFGKKPSRADLSNLLEQLGKEKAKLDDGQEALDFFNSDDAAALDSPGVHLQEDLDEEDVKEIYKEELDEETEALVKLDDDDDEESTDLEVDVELEGLGDDDEEEITDEEFEEFMEGMEDDLEALEEAGDEGDEDEAEDDGDEEVECQS